MNYAGLGRLSPQQFLQDYWQKRPLVIRQAFADWHNPLTPEELAGLALEEEVESRLIRQQGQNWQLKSGPLTDKDFRKLPKSHWTLLVQAVDLWSDEVAALKQCYRFVPDWRLDDVMVSLAGSGGGVGPHRDQYDVFLIQGSGRRRWRVGSPDEDCQPLIQPCGLKQLTPFEAMLDEELEPGDLLYLPPGFSHEGIALTDDCMTYSVGFRAPSQTELLSQLADRLLDQQCDSPRFSDPWRSQAVNPALLDQRSVAAFSQLLLSGLQQPEQLQRAIAALLTQSKYSDQLFEADPVEASELSDLLSQGVGLVRAPACRLTYWPSSSGLELAINGELQCLPADWQPAIEALGLHLQLDGSLLPQPAGFIDWLAAQVSQGYWLLLDDSLETEDEYED